MLTIKEYSPYKVILVDEDDNESVLTTEPPNWFDLDILEKILECDLINVDAFKFYDIIGTSVRGGNE